MQLGETGRGDLKKEISEKLNAKPKLKSAANAIAKLKTATIKQLVFISEIVGLLKTVCYHVTTTSSCAIMSVCLREKNHFSC